MYSLFLFQVKNVQSKYKIKSEYSPYEIGKEETKISDKRANPKNDDSNYENKDKWSEEDQKNLKWNNKNRERSEGKSKL